MGGGRVMGSGIRPACIRNPLVLISAVWPWIELLNSSEPEFPHLCVDSDNISLNAVRINDIHKGHWYRVGGT